MEVDRALFPALADGRVYLDSAATALPPRPVLETVARVAAAGGSALRGQHRPGAAATHHWDDARRRVAAHLGVPADELVFTSSATAGLSLLARGFPLRADDVVLLSRAEHHAHILPWAEAARRAGATLRWVPCDARGDLDLAALRVALGPRVRVVALTWLSNITGGRTPVSRVASLVRARAPRARLFLDGCQALPHLPLRPSEAGADAAVFSGHKVYGPLGIGFVWARQSVWEQTAPLLLGGGMVGRVELPDGAEGAPSITLRRGPARFEAGTPDHPAAAGLAAALDFLAPRRDPGAMAALTREARARLARLPGLRLVADPRDPLGLVSFTLDGVHPHDASAVLDEAGLALRAGHHCAQPLLAHLGVRSCLRASFGLYTRPADLDALIDGLAEVQRVFRSAS